MVGHATTLDGPEQYLVHQVRRKEDGTRELRSRFWLRVFTPQIAHDLLVHCNIEMTREFTCFLAYNDEALELTVAGVEQI